MWLLVALAACGHVRLHSISHQVYTWNIPGIYLVYANKNVIYQVYTWYILMGKSIYQVYTWYKTCIYLSYDDIQYIPDIHLLKIFCDISVPVTLRFGHGVYLVYTRFCNWIFFFFKHRPEATGQDRAVRIWSDTAFQFKPWDIPMNVSSVSFL